MKNIGYCCIPLGCNQDKKKKDHIQVNRSMVRKTFDAKGLPYVSELIILNLKDTLKVLDWNLISTECLVIHFLGCQNITLKIFQILN